MAKGDKPVERIKLKRKDGKNGKGTNRDGSSYEAMHVELGCVWANEKGRSVQLAPDFGITYKGKPIPDSFINIFDATPGSAPKGTQAADVDDDF